MSLPKMVFSPYYSHLLDILIDILLLLHPNGNRVLNDSYEYYLRRVCKRLGITTTHNHAFRVAFNARLIEAGMTCNDRCLILGHSMQTNERHYSFSDKRRAENIKNMLKSFETGL